MQNISKMRVQKPDNDNSHRVFVGGVALNTSPKIENIANCIIARYDAGITNTMVNSGVIEIWKLK